MSNGKLKTCAKCHLNFAVAKGQYCQKCVSNMWSILAHGKKVCEDSHTVNGTNCTRSDMSGFSDAENGKARGKG